MYRATLEIELHLICSLFPLPRVLQLFTQIYWSKYVKFIAYYWYHNALLWYKENLKKKVFFS